MKTGAPPEAAPSTSNRKPLPEALTVGLPFVLLTGVFLYHWMKVWVFAIDIPFWDEWDDLPQRSAWEWIWGQHGEHRIPTMKLLVSLMYRLNGWDMAALQGLNFGIFGLVIGALYLLLRRGEKALPAGLALLLLIFPLSPRAAEVHHWSIAGHFHFAFLFLFLAIYLLFTDKDGKQPTSHLILGAVCGILSIYSFGSGLSAMLIVTVVYGVYKLSRAKREPSQRNLELGQLGLVAGLIILSLAAYTIGYKAPSSNALPLPIHRQFWDFFVTLLSYGMGFRSSLPVSYAVGLLYLALIALPWLFLARNVNRGEATWDSSTWAILAGALSITGALMGTSIGRGATGYEQAQASRYSETTMMLIPLIGASWWIALANAPKIRGGVLIGFVLLSIAGFGLTWKSIDEYELTYLIRQNEARRLTRCYNAGVACKVPNLYPTEITVERLNQIRGMNYSFMKKLLLGNW